MEKGKEYRLVKPTFLHQGVLINQNSVVTIHEISQNGISIIYHDAENIPHIINGLKSSDFKEL